MDENWRTSFWTRLSDYLSRRALINEYFIQPRILSPIEGIELLANLTSVEDCTHSERIDFSNRVLNGWGKTSEECGWNSNLLHMLANGSAYFSIRHSFKGTVGNMQVKDKAIKKKGKKLHVVEFVYPVNGIFSEGLIISKDRHIEGDFVIDKFRGFESASNPRLHLIRGTNRIAATLEKRCGVSVDNPVGIFLFEDENGNVYVNPPMYS